MPNVALLDRAAVASALGGSWTTSATGAGGGCSSPRASGTLGTKSVGFTSGVRRVTETVATHPSPEAAAAAVGGLGRALRACGWQPTEAVPLGEASVQLTRGTGNASQTALALAAEGVTIVLVGSGGAAAEPMTWEGLADIALGTSCPAAPDGCH